MFNRKERLHIAKKIGVKGGKRPAKKGTDWRTINAERRQQREKQTIEELEGRGQFLAKNSDNQEAQPSSYQGNQKTWYSLSVALPGSILNNVQTYELKTYVTGELARNFAIFCVDEVVIFDETARLKEAQVDAYYSGEWTGAEYMNETNCECNFYLARVLEYLECPQYLRKLLFPIQKPLKYAGVLNPLDAMHHLRFNDVHLPYREGVILDRQAKNGLLCDVGLDKELVLKTDAQIPEFTRVTVKIDERDNNMQSKKLRGTLMSAKQVRKEAGIYWGYSVRIAKCLSEVVSDGNYDVVIGTSEKGKPIREMAITPKKDCKIMVVFGGLDGLEAAVESDEHIRQSDPTGYFPSYVNCLPDQGSRVIRTEEAIPITLTALKCQLDALPNSA